MTDYLLTPRLLFPLHSLLKLDKVFERMLEKYTGMSAYTCLLPCNIAVKCKLVRIVHEVIIIIIIFKFIRYLSVYYL